MSVINSANVQVGQSTTASNNNLGSHIIPASGSAYASLRRDTTNSVSGTAPGTAATGDIYQGTFSYILG